jgi:hypothetical protein
MQEASRPTPTNLDFRFGGFGRLMPHRIEHVLVVSSLYESFILEEDGLVTELITSEYVDMKLSNAPRVSRATTPADALEIIERDRVDLVITMTRLGNWNVGKFAQVVRQRRPDMPVVVLAADRRELLRHMETTDSADVNQFFLWHGDAKILLAIIKLIEDVLNAEHDTRVGNVRIIILVENSVRFYSTYLPLIYGELVKLTESLMDEGINRMQRLLRMRARPKILLAETYEEAWTLYDRYSKYLLGVISDVRFPKGGKLHGRAGLEFTSAIQEHTSDIPILLQSSDASHARAARRMGVGFLNKRSPSLLHNLRSFILGSMGFGDFVFTHPDGTLVGKANDLRSFRKMVGEIPDECLAYHAYHNHFSNWLMARTEFDLASRIKPKRVSDFPTLGGLRDYLLATMAEHRERGQTGMVTDFSAKNYDYLTTFARIGGGSMGGKARGLAFMNALLRQYELDAKFENVRVCVPNCAAVGTDVFDAFMDKNRLHDIATQDSSDEEISAAFRRAKIPRSVHRKLAAFVKLVDYPLAVRSSSLLEDSQDQSFAGVYTTHMLPNNHPDFAVRLDQVCDAIKLVYASTFFRDAKRYLDATAHHVEGEKMGVLLQEIVGTTHGQHFYPTFAGVARSYNFYPTARMVPEEGIAQVALGLGKMVVEGGQSLMFSPAHPQNIPQFSSIKGMLANSQREFFALDVSSPDVYPTPDSNANLARLGLEVAEADGTLAPIGSVYSADNDAVFDGLSRPGARLVTFAHVLKAKLFPLAEIIRTLLDIGREAMGGPIEIEYAVDLSRELPVFGFLQIRPSVADEDVQQFELQQDELDKALCWSPQAMGNGRFEDVEDLVYVRPEAFDARSTREIADQIGTVNDELRRMRRPFILIGPGRWGSADRFLGVPVTWGQISGARLIVETTLNDFIVAPSQGTHFFQNLSSFRVAYFTVNPVSADGAINWAMLNARPAQSETEFIRHVRFDRPLVVKIDGRTQKGAIFVDHGYE